MRKLMADFDLLEVSNSDGKFFAAGLYFSSAGEAAEVVTEIARSFEESRGKGPEIGFFRERDSGTKAHFELVMSMRANLRADSIEVVANSVDEVAIEHLEQTYLKYGKLVVLAGYSSAGAKKLLPDCQYATTRFFVEGREYASPGTEPAPFGLLQKLKAL